MYRDRPSPNKAQARQAGAAAAGGGGIALAGGVGVAARAVAAPGQEKQPDTLPGSGGPRPKAGEAVLHLRSGDTIPGTVLSIDERGITYQSSVSDATFVAHDQVQALELMPEAKSTSIVKQKKERLLTVPRMQRDSPPTHLIRSDDGDYLRCRLVSMNNEQLEVEVRLETKTLPRKGIARIIWLHPDGAEEAVERQIPAGMRVQALQGDGNRLTFYATRFAGSVLSGTSELLGNCHVDVGTIDELLIGTTIEEAAAALVFHQWKLTPALEPLANPDGEGEGGEATGLDSPLVGKAAPDFQLDMLDGPRFVLAEQRNSVLVLDFWASWCGPCRQAMPQVDKVAREFADQGVKLVAVNLSETPEQIRTALEQLQISVPVALDRQGRVAEQYGATAIPQTVIVARDGTVARLFVGGGNHFEEQLRAALRNVLNPEPPASESP